MDEQVNKQGTNTDLIENTPSSSQYKNHNTVRGQSVVLTTQLTMAQSPRR